MKKSSSSRLEELEARLMDEDEDTRYDAAREIALKERPPMECILAWAKDARPRMREMACFILGCRGYTDDTKTTTAIIYPEAVPTLVRLLDDPDEEVRVTAIR